MRKPVCTVYWIKDGEENHHSFRSSDAAQFFIDGLKRENVCYWICWTSLSAKLVA